MTASDRKICVCASCIHSSDILNRVQTTQVFVLQRLILRKFRCLSSYMRNITYSVRQYRPVYCEGIDADACPMGVPSYVPEARPGPSRYFFIELQRLTEEELLDSFSADFQGLGLVPVGPCGPHVGSIRSSMDTADVISSGPMQEGLDMWSPR
jgi:hypothetical protein